MILKDKGWTSLRMALGWSSREGQGSFYRGRWSRGKALPRHQSASTPTITVGWTHFKLTFNHGGDWSSTAVESPHQTGGWMGVTIGRPTYFHGRWASPSNRYVHTRSWVGFHVIAHLVTSFYILDVYDNGLFWIESVVDQNYFTYFGS